MDRIKGLDGVVRTLEKHIQAVIKSQGAALYMAANEVMTLAKEHTPLDLGPLQNSGYVSLPETSGTKTTVEMGFGGPAESYAIKQHEDMSLHHPDPNRGAKFLENALDAKRAQIMEDMPLLLKVALMSGTPATMSKEHATNPDSGTAFGNRAVKKAKASRARGVAKRKAKRARMALRRRGRK